MAITDTDLQGMSLDHIKRMARDLYLAATRFGDLSCGRAMAEYLRPEIGIARKEFSRLWVRVRELDPDAPPDMFADYRETETRGGCP